MSSEMAAVGSGPRVIEVIRYALRGILMHFAEGIMFEAGVADRRGSRFDVRVESDGAGNPTDLEIRCRFGGQHKHP